MAPPRTSSIRSGSPGSSTPYRDGGFLASVVRFWQKSYASDYIGFTLLFTGYVLIQAFVEPFHRLFSLSDLRIAYPHAAIERVPLAHAFIYALFIPLAIMLAHNLLTRSPAHKHHVSVLGLLIAMILTSFLTDIVKNTVGRPRPDLLARCVPAPNTPRDSLVSIAACTETRHHTLHDGWRSFPSGHSSFAFAGLGYLSLFLAGQTRIFAHGYGSRLGERRMEKLVRGDLLRALLCLVPLVGAMLIAISRCQDYRHDVYDVSVGGLLGWTVSYWSYRRYWPRLGSSRCHEPHAGPPAGGGGDDDDDLDARYGRVRDEEERGSLGHNAA
ncbi:phosphatidic acid phosphatase type 2/haloperoxidase [Podospora appendiculata]|uniref:Phosphatidic acid phosphatase type 2/haloperoxidase n=1 Tax=Podospora appendiculata TaxID=314037 RepID=A0AAE0XGZ5_9PEZI|nr:phosphatidic acid phosphatase type 2/haloperoxidase [Podospora appendiculata]